MSEDNRMMQFLKKNKKIAILAGILIVLAVLFFALRGSGSTQTAYQTAKVEKGELVATVGATGTVRARQSVTLVWQTSGSVDEVLASVGDRVSADAILATLSPTSVAQNIILAEADLVGAQKSLEDLVASDTVRAQAWIALRNSQDDYDVAKDLYDTLVSGPYEYEQIVYVTMRGMRVPTTEIVKVDQADPETIADAEADMVLKKAKLDDAQRAYDRYGRRTGARQRRAGHIEYGAADGPVRRHGNRCAPPARRLGDGWYHRFSRGRSLQPAGGC
jgi:multidrug efflux pump subunit AcrA (membrane-fusion protein)